MTAKQYKKLNNSEKAHLAECFDGSPSKVTLARIAKAVNYQAANNCTCYDYNRIARKLGVTA